jgi:hypothetical protein
MGVLDRSYFLGTGCWHRRVVLYIKAYAGVLAAKTKNWRKLQLVGQLAIMLGYFGKYEETHPWVSERQLIADFTVDIGSALHTANA